MMSSSELAADCEDGVDVVAALVGSEPFPGFTGNVSFPDPDIRGAGKRCFSLCFRFVFRFVFVGFGGPGGGFGGFLLGSRSSGLPLLLLPT